MFTVLFLLFSLFSSVSAVSPLNKPVIRKATAPLENAKLFEQSDLLKDVQPAFLREAELKHGRLAMVSAVLLPVSEQFSDKLGIHFFQDHPDVAIFGTSFMIISEFASMIRGWENPTVKPFALKEDYQPGDFGLTLGVIDESLGTKMDKELNNGRLAMIGILGMMAQELATQQHLF